MIRILFFILIANFPILAFNQVKIGDMLYITDGQNLIRNGDLEEHFYIYPSILFAENWFMGFGTPDYFTVLNSVPNTSRGVPVNSFGYQWPKIGQGYLGFGVFVSDNGVIYSEAVSHFLETELIQGKYIIRLHYNFAGLPNSIKNVITLDRLGVSLNNITAMLANWNDIHLFNPVKEFEVVQDTANWVNVELIIDAHGGESVVSIGNFSEPNSLEMQYFSLLDTNSVEWITYYYIDDVSMYRIIDSIPVADSVAVTNVTLYPNPSPNGQFTLEYAVHEDAQPVFSVYDATGRLVGSQTLPGGQQRVPLDYSYLANGVYLWRLEQNQGFVGGGKMSVMR